MNRAKYTPEMMQFIREYAPGHWVYEIVDAVYEKFGVKISKSGIKSKLQRLRVSTNAKTGAWHERAGTSANYARTG